MHILNRFSKKKERTAKGQMACLGFLGVLIVAMFSACMSVDVAHGVLVHHQIQSACDAAALTGVTELTMAPGMSQEALKLAEINARHILAAHHTDQISLSDDDNTTITIEVDGRRMPRSTEVIVNRKVSTIFGRFFGINTFPVEASAKAQASLGLSSVAPGQMTNIAISLDTNPEEGVMKGNVLNRSDGPTTLVVGGKSNRDKNSDFIADWHGKDSPLLALGQTMPGLGGSDTIANIEEKATIVVPIIQGDPPFRETNIVGFTGFHVITKYNVGRPLLVGSFRKVVLLGKPGLDTSRANKRDQEKNSDFLYRTAPWKVMLVR